MNQTTQADVDASSVLAKSQVAAVKRVLAALPPGPPVIEADDIIFGVFCAAEHGLPEDNRAALMQEMVGDNPALMRDVYLMMKGSGFADAATDAIVDSFAHKPVGAAEVANRLMHAGALLAQAIDTSDDQADDVAALASAAVLLTGDEHRAVTALAVAASATHGSAYLLLADAIRLLPAHLDGPTW